MQTAQARPGVRGIRDAMRTDHERLEALTEHLIAAVREGDSGDIAGAWKLFEGDLLAHFEDEERRMLPVFDRVAPQIAARLRAEHAHLRSVMDRVAREIQLHQMRETTIIELVHMLRKHAAREERTLYPWADAQLAGRDRRAILRRVRHAIGGDTPEPGPRAGEAGQPVRCD